MNTLLYHITHMSNIPSILKNGGLFAHSVMQQKQLDYQDVANVDVQDKREQKIVPIPPGGNLHDYVPFYFAPRSPMLYVLLNGGIAQEDIVYVMTNTQTIEDHKYDYVFTNSHAIMRLTNYYSSLDELEKIDWDVMKSPYWHDTHECPNRKTKRQAEFLVYKQVALSACIGFAVYNEEAEQKLRKILNTYQQELFIGIRPGYYF